MILAIIGLFDSKLTEEIHGLQKALVDAGVSDHTFQSAIGPHVTFLGFETDSAEAAIACAARVCGGYEGRQFYSLISSYGIFPFEKKVVFALPVLTEDWIQLHRQLVFACLEEKEAVETFHLPGKWVPHITLASRLTSNEVLCANELLLRKFAGYQGKMDRLAVIDCENEEILWESLYGVEEKPST